MQYLKKVYLLESEIDLIALALNEMTGKMDKEEEAMCDSIFSKLGRDL